MGRRANATAGPLFPTDPPPDPGSRLELRPGVAGAPSASTPPYTQRLPPSRPAACAGERACTHARCTKTSTPLQPGERTPFGSAHSGAHAPAPSRSYTRTYTHPACALTYTHTRGAAPVWTLNADLRALTRLSPAQRLAGRRAHTRTPAPRALPARVLGSPAPRLPVSPPRPRRALCGAAGPGGGGGPERGGGGAGAGNRLARAPPVGRGFSSLGADAADLPAAASDHGRQRDAVSAGGGRSGARGGEPGESAGGGPSPCPGCACAAAPPPLAPRLSALLHPRSPVWSPAGLGARGPGRGDTRARTHSLTPSTGCLAQGRRGQADTQWHTFMDTQARSSMGALFWHTLTFTATCQHIQ